MTENNSSLPDSPEESESRPTNGIRERTERLREKVGDLSKTLDRIEQTLAEAAGESNESRD